MTAVIPAVRNAEFGDLLAILNDQQVRKVDLVIPATKLRFEDGYLVIADREMILEDDGFTNPNGRYLPTAVFDDSAAERLDIHASYLRRLRNGKNHAKTGKLIAEPRLDLYDVNLNGLLQGRRAKTKLVRNEDNEYDTVTLAKAIDGDARSFLVRLFRGDDGTGIARALLSNRFARLDNLDGLMAMLQGIQEAGIDPSTLRIHGDITETRMYVHVEAPEIATLAPKLLEGYRSPFDTGVEGAKRQARGHTLEERIELGRQFLERGHGDGHHSFYAPGTEPIVHSGFKLANSEVGNGRWTITPELTVLQCSNGLTMTKEAFGRTHVGSTMEDGHIEWSADTQSKELAFVTAQTRDLVKMALSQDYVEAAVARLEENSDKVIADPEKAIEVLGQRLKFSKEEQAGILKHFLMSGQHTAGGVMQSITSFSQTLDADAQYDLDGKAVAALEMAARL